MTARGRDGRRNIAKALRVWRARLGGGGRRRNSSSSSSSSSSGGSSGGNSGGSSGSAPAAAAAAAGVGDTTCRTYYARAPERCGAGGRGRGGARAKEAAALLAEMAQAFLHVHSLSKVS